MKRKEDSMKQYAVELHSHTNHSDAHFTVAELCQEASNFGYDGLILTDHNTASGYPEFKKLADEKGLVTMRGIEWTTYFGHMLVHGADYLVDWRDAQPTTIDYHIQEVKNAGGLVGIAHPYAIGSPMCTGCHWSFEVENWKNVDYIEIWNEVCPDESLSSWEAYARWTHLLDQGYRISASAGRDWHRLEGLDKNPAVTYIETVGQLTPTSFRQALEKGAFYLTLGPKLDWQIGSHHMGDTIPTGIYVTNIQAKPFDLPAFTPFNPRANRVKIIHNGEVYLDIPITEEKITLSLHLQPGYVRLELWGAIKDKTNELLLVSNPIYIEK
ncbi:CehA/McbA family metallohydrolase [Jeotgalibaca sp. A127]|uniref:CehA/McbA family metallohydrolase n=1 Tax=Jeotgalibaca sp. A127 TaxID=3457324 RepID=UPI003FD16D79